MPTTSNPGQGRREYRIAVSSLKMAKELRDLLGAHPLPDNDYYDEALGAAINLVDEMERNMEDVRERWTQS